MIRAFIYLQLTSVRNGLGQRLRRLKQPKYLFGALFGAAYFYIIFFRHALGHSSSRSRPFPTLDPELVALVEPGAAVMLLGVAVLAWLLPAGRATLHFTEAEVAFLFPAPIARRTLIHFKLLKSQLTILFSSLILSLLSHRVTWLGGNALTHALGWWVVLSSVNLYLLGSSFARERLLQRGVSARVRLAVTLGVVAAAALGTWVWVRATLPPVPIATGSWADWETYAHGVRTAPPVVVLLFLPQLVVKPFFAPDVAAFTLAFGPALLVLAATYWWVIRSEVAFEEASIAQARELAEKVAAVRAGDWRGATNQPRKPRPAPFVLAARGAVVVAFLWKSLLALGPFYRLRTWLIAVAVIIAGHAWVATLDFDRRLYVIGGVVPLAAAAWLLVVGPMFMRRDLRLLVTHFDVLKSYPLRGWQVILGSLLSPIVVLAAWEWLLLLIGAPCVGLASRSVTLSAGVIGSGALGIALILPPLAGLMLSIPFAATLYFPAWADSASNLAGGGGLEAAGQRLIFFFGYVVVLLVALIPAGLCAGVTAIIAHWAGGPITAIVATTVVASTVIGAEWAAVVWWLGERFERFDLAQELPR